MHALNLIEHHSEYCNISIYLDRKRYRYLYHTVIFGKKIILKELDFLKNNLKTRMWSTICLYSKVYFIFQFLTIS